MSTATRPVASLPRTLFVSHSGEIAGGELVLFEQLARFRAPHAVTLLADGPFRTRLESAGVPTTLIAGSAGFSRVRRGGTGVSPRTLGATAAVALRLARVVRGYDLVIANSEKAFVAAALATSVVRRPLVWVLHDILSREHFSPRLIALVVRLANQRATRVVCVSTAARDAAVAAGLDAAKAVVSHIGVEPAPFAQPDRATVASIRTLAGDGVLVGAFSRLAPWKGQHVLLEALLALPEVHAVIVGGALFGEDAYEARLHAQAHALGIADRVHFLGQRDDVASVMHAVDVIVHSPTAPEPFGRVVVEAMLSGRPLVTVLGGGIPEIVRDGETALAVPKAEPDAIARAVRALLADPPRARRIATAARARALQHFTADVAAAEFERQVLGAVA